jgi:hypothetical protein
MRVIVDIFKEGGLYDSFSGEFDRVLDELTDRGYDSDFVDRIDTAIGRLWADTHTVRHVDYSDLTAEIRKD